MEHTDTNPEVDKLQANYDALVEAAAKAYQWLHASKPNMDDKDFPWEVYAPLAEALAKVKEML